MGEEKRQRHCGGIAETAMRDPDFVLTSRVLQVDYDLRAELVVRRFLEFPWDRVEPGVNGACVVTSLGTLYMGSFSSYFAAGMGKFQQGGNCICTWGKGRPSLFTLWRFSRKLAEYRAQVFRRNVEKLKTFLY